MHVNVIIFHIVLVCACCTLYTYVTTHIYMMYCMLFSPRTSRSRHIIPFRRFLEGVFGQDLRSFFAESCFEVHAQVDYEKYVNIVPVVEMLLLLYVIP